MKSVALIPARGGSKRLPRKNVLPFLGKPLMAYSIEAARETGLFDRVVVSTDDEEFADVARASGADVLMRDAALATDKAMVRAVAADFIDAEEQAGRGFDLLCVLYATAPLRGAEDIRGVYDLIEEGVCHHALAVKDYTDPPHQALKVVSDRGDLEPMWPDIVAARADSLPEFMVDNGSTYCVMVEDFKATQNFYADKMRGYHMPHWKSVDMDTRDDFELLEYFARKYGGLA